MWGVSCQTVVTWRAQSFRLATVPAVDMRAVVWTASAKAAPVLADNLVAVLTAAPGQEPLLESYAHENLGTVASLGIGKGVARILGHSLRGFVAWTAHRGYHVYAVPTLNRKVRIMMDWFAAVVFRRDLASFGSVAAPGVAFARATANDARIASRHHQPG